MVMGMVERTVKCYTVVDVVEGAWYTSERSKDEVDRVAMKIEQVIERV